MAKTNIEELVVKMSADLASYQKQMLKAQGVANKTAGNIVKKFNDMNRGLTGSLSMLGNAFKGAFAAFSIERFATAARSAIKSLADIGDAADKLGMSTDEFQQAGFAAQLAGVEAETFAGAMKKLALNSSEASRGQGELGAILDANNVKITDGSGALLSQIEIMQVVADLIRNAANEQDQAVIATAAFGKSGVDMLNLLAQGGDAVSAAMRQAKSDGIAFSEEQIRKAQEIDDKFDTLEKRISVALKGAVLTFAEDVETGAGRAQAAIAMTTEWVNSLTASFNQAAQAAQMVDRSLKGDMEQFVDRAGKGSLPSNMNVSGQTFKPTIIPPPKTRAPKVHVPKVTKAKERDKGPNEYQRSVEQIRENIAMLQSERDAIMANVTAVDGYDMAVEKARIAQQLMNDAKAAGVKITPELKASIDQLAGTYASMQQQVDKAREEHEKFVASMDEAKATAKDVLGGFVQDLVDGKSAVDALSGALDKIVSKLLDMAVNNLVENAFGGLMGGGSGGGFFSSLFGGLFGGSSAVSLYHNGGEAGRMNGGRRNVHPALFAGAEHYHSGGIAGLKPGEVPAILKRGEIVIPRGGASGGGRSVTVVNHFHGVAGNSEIRRIAQQATRDGIRGYAKARPQADLERQLRME